MEEVRHYDLNSDRIKAASINGLLEMIVKDVVYVWVGLDDIRRRRRSSCALKMFLSLTVLR